MGGRFSFSLRHFAFSPCSPANSFSHFWASMAFYGFLSLLLLTLSNACGLGQYPPVQIRVLFQHGDPELWGIVESNL